MDTAANRFRREYNQAKRTIAKTTDNGRLLTPQNTSQYITVTRSCGHPIQYNPAVITEAIAKNIRCTPCELAKQ